MISLAFFRNLTAVLLIEALVLPAAFLAVPTHVNAYVVPVIDVGNAPAHTGNFIQDTIHTAYGAITSFAAHGGWVYDYVLKPIAWIVASMLIQEIAMAIITKISGEKGVPGYVQKLAIHLQKVGDKKFNAFYSQYATNVEMSSPFGSAISSSLRSRYLQGTSDAGYFAASQCTLLKVSANPKAFLSGFYNQGGVGAWFSLTLQKQNNPYLAYLDARDYASEQVQTSQTQRSQELNWGQGFISWCGDEDLAAPVDVAADGTGHVGAQCSTSNSCATGLTCDTDIHSDTYATCVGTESTPPAAAVAGKDAGDACTKDDGSPGKIKTPGSLIHDSVAKAFGAPMDRLVQSKEIDQALNAAMVAIITSAVTKGLDSVQGAVHEAINGTGDGGSPGGDPDPAATEALTRGVAYARDILSKLDSFDESWGKLKHSADEAKGSLETLSSVLESGYIIGQGAMSGNDFLPAIPASAPPSGSCKINLEQASVNGTNTFTPVLITPANVQTALNSNVQYVLDQYESAITASQKARALAEKIAAEAGTTDPLVANTTLSDILILEAGHPSVDEIAKIQTDAEAFGGVSVSRTGALNAIIGGTTRDQMDFIDDAATQAASQCCFTNSPTNSGASSIGFPYYYSASTLASVSYDDWGVGGPAVVGHCGLSPNYCFWHPNDHDREHGCFSNNP